MAERKDAKARRALGHPAWRLRDIHPVWWLNLAVVGSCAALLATVVGGYSPFAHTVVPWWALAAFVAVTERWPVHFEFRRSAHSFSLTDVPVALAVIFFSGPVGVGAVALGSVPALLLRRLPPIKFVFNLAQFTVAVCVGYLTAHLIAGGTQFGPRVWAGTLLGLQVGGLATIVLLCGVVFLAEGALTREQVRQMFGMDALVTATNTSLALLLAVILEREPAAAPILALPLAIAFFAYRSYVSERQRHEKIEFLYEANRSLSQSSEVALALEGLLERALEAYRAEHAEVILFAADGGSPLRTSLTAGGEGEAMAAVRHDDADALRALLERSGRPLALEPPFSGTVGEYLAHRRIRHAMVAELRGEERVVGVLMLANRFGVARTFSEDDLALFETLAANASAALQFDRLEQAVSELRALQDQLRHQAYHDPLTGLANRTLFNQEVRAALSAAAGEGTGVAVMFIDLDDFKTVNDTLGHAVGDELLRAVTVRLSACVREQDLVARLGGDEFAVLLRGRPRAEEAAVDVARRILDAFQTPVVVGGEDMRAGLSLGVATSDHSGDRTEDLMRDADVAMYEAKEAGKGRMAVFDPAMREVLMRRHGLREELQVAIDKGDLVVQYQPIVDIATGHTYAMEALVRWNHADRGRIPPGEFIPLAEETGLVVGLGRFVLDAACREAASWPAEPGIEAPVVQVNLSALELEDDGLVSAVTDALARTGLEPRRLVLEITETLLMQDAARAVARLNALRELGVQLALDDFGTGYSSLSYLRSLPLDMLKIAKPFVDSLAIDARDEAFVRLMVELADDIGLRVVAEGIETSEQLAVLRGLGCELGQGFLFAAPVDDVGPWVRAGVPRAS